jgi:hypothetical protein
MVATVGEAKTIKLWSVTHDGKWSLTVPPSNSGNAADLAH